MLFCHILVYDEEKCIGGMNMAKTTVERHLYYYDLYALCQDEKTKGYIRSGNLITEFFETLFNLQNGITDYKDFVEKTRNKDNIFVIVDTFDISYIEFRIVLCRTDALPFIEKEGKLEKLGDYIDEDQNIAEITHCVFFPAYNIMGAEYNFSGARPTTISDYILKRGTSAELVTCRAKLNYDAYEKLIEGEEYSLFDFSVKTDSDAYNKMLSQKSIFRAIQAEVPETDTFEVVLKKRKTRKNKFSGFMAPLSQEEIKYLLDNYRDDIERFSVSQSTFNDKIDLLSDKLVNKVIMTRTSERTIDSKEMYKEIRRYFDSTVVKYCKK